MFISFMIMLVLVLSVSVNQPDTPSPPMTSTSINLSPSRRPVQALYQIEATVIRDGWNFDRHRQAGYIAADLGDMVSAAAHWQAALTFQPESIELLQTLAQHYLNQQAWTDAADTLRALIAVMPANTWAQFQLGLILAPIDPKQAFEHLGYALDDNQYREQAFKLRTILTEYPNGVTSGITAVQIGVTLAELSLWGQAEFAFRHAADVQQGNPQPYAETLAYIGFTREMQGKTSVEWIDQAVALAPDNPQVRYLQGLSLRNRAEYQASIEAFGLAMLNDPTNPAYYIEIGNTYWQTQDVVSAEYWLREAVKVSNGDPQFLKLYNDFYTLEMPRLMAAGVIITATPIPPTLTPSMPSPSATP